MAFKLAEAFVSIVARDNQLKQGLERSRRTISQEIGQLQGLLTGLGLGIGGGATLGLAVRTAAEAEEINSKFEAVFKELTEDARAWTSDFAREVGRGFGGVQKQMAEFQDTFVPLGFARERAAELSKDMTRLTADLASFNNIADSEAQANLTSGLVGNHEALRRFGVIITQATLKQELLNMGIKGGVQGATEQEKVLARLNIIMASTSDAQGDAVRTAGSLTNRMKGLRGAASGVIGAIGAELLPIMATLAKGATDALFAFGDLNAELDGFPARATAASLGVVTLAGALKLLQMQGIRTSQLLRLAFIGTGVGALIVLLGSVVAGLIEIIRWLKSTAAVQAAWQEGVQKLQLAWENFKIAFAGIFEGIRNTFNTIVTWMNDTWGFNFEEMADTFSGWVAQVIGMLTEFVLDVSEWLRVIVDNWDTVWELIGNRGQIAVLFLRDIFMQLPRFWTYTMGRLIRLWFDVWSTIIGFLGKVLDQMVRLLIDFVDWAWAKVKSIFTGDRVESLTKAALNMVAKEAAAVGDAFQAGLFKRGMGDMFEPSPELQAALERQEQLIDKLANAKRELEAQRADRMADEEAPAEMEAKVKDQAVENMNVDKMEIPKGFFAFDQLQRKIQEGLLKDSDPQKKMAGLMQQDVAIQREQNRLMEEIATNTSRQPAVARA